MNYSTWNFLGMDDIKESCFYKRWTHDLFGKVYYDIFIWTCKILCTSQSRWVVWDMPLSMFDCKWRENWEFMLFSMKSFATTRPIEWDLLMLEDMSMSILVLVIFNWCTYLFCCMLFAYGASFGHTIGGIQSLKVAKKGH
jgi:hypothetical protein